MECTYCILRSYLNNEALVVCTNFEDLLWEVGETLRQNPARTFRIGTGELADSLALDHITCFSRKMVPFFASLPNAILELKTKSDQISNLKDLDHGGRTIISWSMNSKRICCTEEFKTATFEERIEAALQCQKWGYKLGFHFDPIIYYEGWEGEYREAIREIFSVIDPGSCGVDQPGRSSFPAASEGNSAQAISQIESALRRVRSRTSRQTALFPLHPRGDLPQNEILDP